MGHMSTKQEVNFVRRLFSQVSYSHNCLNYLLKTLYYTQYMVIHKSTLNCRSQIFRDCADHSNKKSILGLAPCVYCVQSSHLRLDYSMKSLFKINKKSTPFGMLHPWCGPCRLLDCGLRVAWNPPSYGEQWFKLEQSRKEVRVTRSHVL